MDSKQENLKNNTKVNSELEVTTEEVPCKTHPDAPHGFNRTASHTMDRYVCDCEFWSNK